MMPFEQRSHARVALGLALIFAVWTGGAATPSAEARGVREYMHSGRVTAIQGDLITIGEGGEALEFTRSDLGLREIRLGDSVTVHYTLDARKFEPAPVRPSRQLPGRAAPRVPAPQPSAHPARGPVIDDRAFYDARVGTPPGLRAQRVA